jgi:hypothetical protein
MASERFAIPLEFVVALNRQVRIGGAPLESLKGMKGYRNYEKFLRMIEARKNEAAIRARMRRR